METGKNNNPSALSRSIMGKVTGFALEEFYARTKAGSGGMGMRKALSLYYSVAKEAPVVDLECRSFLWESYFQTGIYQNRAKRFRSLMTSMELMKPVLSLAMLSNRVAGILMHRGRFEADLPDQRKDSDIMDDTFRACKAEAETALKKAVGRLAEKVSDSSELKEVFDLKNEEISGALEESHSPEARNFRFALIEFARNNGWMGASGFDCRDLSLRENRQVILSLIKNVLCNKTFPVGTIENQAAGEKSPSGIAGHLLGNLIRNTERIRLMMYELMARLIDDGRETLRAIAEELAGEGVIEAREDIYMLTLEELGILLRKGEKDAAGIQKSLQ